MSFIRINKTLEDRGILLEAQEAEAFFSSTIEKENTLDWYHSLFTFGEEAKEHYDNKGGSLAGYTGPAYTYNLVFDLDNADLEAAKLDVGKLLSRLSKEVGLGKEGINKHVRVYFSGNKGFHVFVKTTHKFTPDELKSYCKVIAGDLSSFDPKIYNTTRCFRVSNTLNLKSNLYKIPISLDLIKDKDGIAKIKELAVTPQKLEDMTVPLADFSIIEKYVSIKKDIKKNSVVVDDVEEINGIRGLANIDFKKGKGVPKCIYALSQGVMVPGKGQRHEVFLHLGNYYRNQGHNAEVVEGILTGIAKLNHKLYPEHNEFSKGEIKNSIIKMVFSDEEKLNIGGWGVAPENEIFAAYCKATPCTSNCPIHSKTKKSLITIDEIASDFIGFAANFQQSVVETGIEFIDKNVKIAKGTTALVVGSSGSGKTSLCLNVFEKLNEKKQNNIFFSLDMHKNLVYMKLAQRHTAYSQEEIFRIFETQDYKKMSEIKDIIKKYYGHTYFDFSGSLSIEDIVQRTKAVEDQSGEKIHLVVIDYASRLTGPHSDSNANETYNALRSKQAADDTDAAWIILNQISRASGSGFSPLRSKRVAKGSSAWEESTSIQLNVWRTFMGLHNTKDPENGIIYNDSYMNVFIAKNRLGPELEGVLHWDGRSGKVRDMSEQEREYYETEEKPKIKLATQYRYNDG
jgi:KaiC/GvpD/RAD55 family RecA-like ATPase